MFSGLLRLPFFTFRFLFNLFRDSVQAQYKQDFSKINFVSHSIQLIQYTKPQQQQLLHLKERLTVGKESTARGHHSIVSTEPLFCTIHSSYSFVLAPVVIGTWYRQIMKACPTREVFRIIKIASLIIGLLSPIHS